MYKTKICDSPLNDFIRGFWEMEFVSSSGAEIKQSLVPSGMPELLFCFGNTSGNTVSFILGQRTKSVNFAAGSCDGIISIIIQPWAMGRFLNLNASLFCDSIFDAFSVIPEASELLERINNCSNFSMRVTVLEAWLTKKIAAMRYQDLPKLQYFSYSAENTQLHQPLVKSIAANSNLSVRQVERIYNNEIGLSPKKYNSILRFQKSIFIKQTKPEISLAALACMSGYTDQAHMSNDYKKLSGISPLNFFNLCSPFSDYYALR